MTDVITRIVAWHLPITALDQLCALARAARGLARPLAATKHAPKRDACTSLRGQFALPRDTFRAHSQRSIVYACVEFEHLGCTSTVLDHYQTCVALITTVHSFVHSFTYPSSLRIAGVSGLHQILFSTCAVICLLDPTDSWSVSGSSPSRLHYPTERRFVGAFPFIQPELTQNLPVFWCFSGLWNFCPTLNPP